MAMEVEGGLSSGLSLDTSSCSIVETTACDAPANISEELLNEMFPHTELSEIMEKYCNTVIGEGVGKVVVRVASYVPKMLQVNPDVAAFLKLQNYNVPETMTYKSRAIICFQATGSGFALFFISYFQEYGNDCPSSNQNMSYISMIDSVNVFNPPSLKRHVIYTILIVYLDYIRSLGFTNLFLWAAPPLTPPFEYLFPERPPGQIIHNVPTLTRWYAKFIEIAAQCGLVQSSRTLVDYLNIEVTKTVPYQRLPLFEEDKWNVRIREILEIETKGMNADEKADFLSNGTVRVATKLKGRKKTVVESKHIKDYVNDVVCSEMLGLKKQFFWLPLSSKSAAITVPEHKEDVVTSKVFDARDALYDFMKKHLLDFSSVSKAENSTKLLLLEYNKIKQLK